MNTIESCFWGSVEMILRKKEELKNELSSTDESNDKLLSICMEVKSQILTYIPRFKLNGEDIDVLLSLERQLDLAINEIKERLQIIKKKSDVWHDIEAMKLGISPDDFYKWFEAMKLEYLGEIKDSDLKLLTAEIFGKEEENISPSEFSQSTVGLLFNYLISTNEVKPVYDIAQAQSLAESFGWQKANSGKSLLDEINRFKTQSSRTGLAEKTRSDNKRKSQFELMIKYCEDHNYKRALSKIKDEYEIFINNYKTLYEPDRK